jgi:4-amino-4-deoxy-L-arabinose transferase-like glycosyltransferase
MSFIRQINRRWISYLILLLSFFLLTWSWDAHGLWDDELYTIQLAQSPTVADIITGSATDVHPPLHYILMRGWIALTGPTDYATRFAAIAAAIVAIALAYQIGRRLFDARTARWTMLLLSISPFLILYARMARYYSFAMMLGLLSLYLFIRLLQDAEQHRLSWGNLIGWVIVSVILLYTDYPTSIVLIGENLLMLIYFKRFRWLWPKWLAAQMVAVAGFLPWAGVVLSQIKQANSAFGGVEFAQGFFGTLFKVGQPIYSFAVGESIMPWHPAAIVGLLAVAILVWLGAREIIAKHSWPHIFVALFLVLPLIYLVAVSFLIAYAFPSRAIVALPFFYLLMIAGARRLTARRSQIVLGGLIIAFVFGLINYYPGYQFINPTYAVPTRSILRAIEAQAQPADVIASETASGFGYYYTLSGDTWPHFTDFDQARSVIEAQHSPRVWLILIGRDSTREQTPTSFIDFLGQDYDLTQTSGFGPVDPIYQQLKSRVLNREVYAYKATLYLYVRRGGP